MSSLMDRLAIALTTVVTLCCVPFFLKFERTHKDWSDADANAIAQMSKSERDDLVANARRLNEFSGEKRSIVEAMHAAVTDPATEQRFNAYHDWLQSLDLFQRDGIRSAETAEDKVSLVQTLLADAEERSQSFVIDPGDGRLSRFRGSKFAAKLKQDLEAAGVSSIRVSDREYDNIVTVLAEGLPDDGKADFEKAVAKLRDDAPEKERYRFRSNALGTVMWNSMRKRGRERPKPDPEAIERVLNQIEDSATREALKQLDLEQKQSIVGMLLFRSLDQFRFIVSYFPSDDDVEKFLSELDRPDQIELMQISTASMRQRVNVMYLAANEDVPTDIREMAKRFERMLRERGLGRGGRRGKRGGPRGGSSRHVGPRRDGERRSGKAPPRPGEPPPGDPPP